jgi:hypothetical protein
MKKVLFVVLALVMLLMTFTACKPAEQSSAPESSAPAGASSAAPQT